MCTVTGALRGVLVTLGVAVDRKKALCYLFVEAVKAYVGDPVRVHLLAGPGGKGLRGSVGWTGKDWLVELDRNIGSPWVVWRSLWHEAAHLVHGDNPKTVDPNGAVDTALIRGVDSSLTRTRAEVWERDRDAALEARCDAWAEARASEWLPSLNDFLTRLEA